MRMKSRARTIVVGCAVVAAGLAVDGYLHSGLIIGEAQARVGRPATPGSVAGVARRTTRRTVRRTTAYVASLPRGCSTVIIDGMSLHQCGTTYYQPYNNQYVIVTVN